MFHCRSRIKFHHAGEIRDGLRARQRQDHAHELHPYRAQALMPRFEKLRRQMRRADYDEDDDYNRSRQRKRYGKTAGMFRPEIIDQAHD